MSKLRYLDGDDVRALGPAAAVAAVEAALRAGLDPSVGVPRSAVPLAHGELLLMPAESPHHVGVKLVTVASGNPARGLPRIGGVYVLFDAATLQPTALLDGVALTTLRTPAVSVAAVRRYLDRVDRPLRVVVFGAGPQGLGHVDTLAAVHPLASVDVVVRDADRPWRPEVAGPRPGLLTVGAPGVADALRVADVVVCATTAREPLFDSDLLGPQTVVVVVGSHDPDAREVDDAFTARASIIVEDVGTARRECGLVVQDVAAGRLDPSRLLPIRGVVADRGRPADGPVLFTGSGMAWQDLVVAEAVLARAAP